MKNYLVTYRGNATRLKNFKREVSANSDREAVIEIYSRYFYDNYFPQEDGSIKDCDGHTIADADDNTIEYDGGCFSAELMEDETI